MQERKVVRAVATVTATWWTAFTALAIRSGELAALGLVPGKLMLTAGGAALGGAASLLWTGAQKLRVVAGLHWQAKRGIYTTLGPLPEGLGQPKRIPGAALAGGEDEVTAWLADARKRHPAHAALFQTLIEVMAAYRDLPAAPVPGGHGGASLFEHSWRVARVALTLAPTFHYEGEKDKKGRIRIPLLDPQFLFDPHDPLIPILAFGHDIGKIECYRLDSGVVREVKQNHDRVGGHLFARLPALWALPKADRDALLLAAAHYHHPNSLPLHANDRARALMWLLIAADLEAGRIEGEDLSREYAAEEGEEPDFPRQLWAAFQDILAQPGRINGNDKQQRIGFKHGSLVYLQEQSLRMRLAEHLDAPKLAGPEGRKGDGMYGITEDLLAILKEKGILYDRHAGREYSEKRALFRVTFQDQSNGRVVGELPACIIIRPELVFPALTQMADCKHPPVDIRPVWGEHSARNKAHRTAETAPTADPQPEPEAQVAPQAPAVPQPEPLAAEAAPSRPRPVAADRAISRMLPKILARIKAGAIAAHAVSEPGRDGQWLYIDVEALTQLFPERDWPALVAALEPSHPHLRPRPSERYPGKLFLGIWQEGGK